MIAMTKAARYRSRDSAHRLIALSLSYERDALLARGLGLEHLQELLILLARPLLRQGASLAYGGNWQERADNFTYELLRLVSAEQDEAAEREGLGDAADVLPVGRLYNYSAWPRYLHITPALEARWINSCRILRVDQTLAGIAAGHCIPDEDVAPDGPDSRFQPDLALNAAICLSAMRRLLSDGFALTSPDVPRSESVPPVSARIVLGGKLQGFSGFLPGIFEEVLLTLERGIPLYLLGGFGGAAEVLAEALLAPAPAPLPEALARDWLDRRQPALAALNQRGNARPLPWGVRGTDAALAALRVQLTNARANLPGALHTGLSDEETRELMRTRDMRRAAALVHKGLVESRQFVMLAA